MRPVRVPATPIEFTRYPVTDTLIMLRASEIAYSTIKKAIYGNPVSNSLMHRWRAGVVERRYRRFARRYASTELSAAANNQLFLERTSNSNFRKKGADVKLKVLWIGTDYLQDSSGILQSLESLCQLTVFEQDGGTYGYLLNGSELSFGMADRNGAKLLQYLKTAKDEGDPFDVVIGQMWGGYTSVESLDQAKNDYGVSVINVGMDDRHTFDYRKIGRRVGAGLLASHVDLALTAASECVAWYQQLGCPALFFPEASDPVIFAPDPQAEKLYDVSFVGAKYGIREQVVRSLNLAGITVQTYGNGWERGRIATEEVPSLFNASRIILGVSTIGSSHSLMSLKMRDFDGPMSGSCYLTQFNADLNKLYSIGDEIMCYDTPENCVEVVTMLLSNDTLRRNIAIAGNKRATADHSWESRFKNLFNFVQGHRINIV